MNDKTKFYIFDKKELALIFLFMLLTSVVAFLLGYKVGDNRAYLEAGMQPEDRAVVELKSAQEEQVEAIESTQQEGPHETLPVAEQSLSRLDGELGKLTETTSEVQASVIETVKPVTESVASKDNEVIVNKAKNDSYSGKYTIQIGSHRSIEEAKQFASGIKALGYNTIINEVNQKDKGLWYRVSIGVFTSIEEAKSYVTEQSSFFGPQDYVIMKFD